MLVSDWRHAIAHVDADCFYASCELARRPDLRGRPVCVLSSQDACVVAKTYDAKAAGISTGMPVWEAKKLLPKPSVPADFGYQTQVRRRHRADACQPAAKKAWKNPTLQLSFI